MKSDNPLDFQLTDAYEIEVPAHLHPKTTKRGIYQFPSSFPELSDEVIAWLNENLKDDWEFTPFRKLRFADPADLILFKLTWTG